MTLRTVGCLIGSFMGAAASTCFFHRPQLNKESIKMLSLDALPGFALAAASLWLGFAAGQHVHDNWDASADDTKKNQQAILTLISVCTLSGIAVAAAAKTLTHRLGTPTEALTKFAVSSVLGFLGIVIAKKLESSK